MTISRKKNERPLQGVGGGEWFPPEDTRDWDHDNLDDLMQDGYSLLENHQPREACEIWLEVWENLKQRFTHEMKDIEEAEVVFSGLQCLFNWCQDLESALEETGSTDDYYCRKRLAYCEEFVSRFPNTDECIVHNMRRAICESYFALGDSKKGDESFQGLIEDYPENIWGYIGWGDLYCWPRYSKWVLPDFDKAERIYSMALGKNLEDEEHIVQRLEDLPKWKRGGA